MNSEEKHIIEDIFKTEMNGTVPPIDAEAEIMKILGEIATDAVFRVPAVLGAENLASKSSKPVFHYVYDYQGTTSLASLFTMKPWQLVARV